MYPQLSNETLWLLAALRDYFRSLARYYSDKASSFEEKTEIHQIHYFRKIECERAGDLIGNVMLRGTPHDRAIATLKPFLEQNISIRMEAKKNRCAKCVEPDKYENHSRHCTNR